MNTLTWYGHACFRIDTGDATLIIDPFITGNPTAPLAAADIDTCDAVLITHDHGDHVGDAVDICRRTGANLVAVVGTAGKLQAAGIPAEQIVGGVGMNIGGTVQVAGVGATMTQAFHSTESGTPTGYILHLPGGVTVYHAGDTGIFSSMGLWGQLYDIDYALLPIGGHFTMDPRQAALACSLLDCANVVPMHWGTFPILEQNTQTLAQALAEFSPDTTLQTLEIGVPFGL